ncbi:MAG: hypothetical protein D3919_15230, partial [Candidatus Electrothrix sp. AW5]|nr:hypothetical protein [Candidatus Electrothrix gigas]
MNNHVENKNGKQNIAQGEHTVVTQIKNYFRQLLKPRFLVITALLVAGMMSAALFIYNQSLHELRLETAAQLEKEQLAKAENLVSRADLQRLQYNYEQSARSHSYPSGRAAA